MLDLLYKNVLLQVSESDKILMDLRSVLNLQTIPRIIECFDISNLGSTYAVGSMVQFRDGKPDKQNYRRFKIKTVINKQDDFSMMREVVYRRYSRLKNNSEEYPDLIMIDGGKGQLSVAFDVLKELDIRIPLISLAKREEEVYFPGVEDSLFIDRNHKGLHLLQQIRDEAHRFGLKYHRLLRSKGMLK